ncbi:MAG: hypothetical protein IIA59_09390 [Candidatus Marinimicrobia bacterium]|nr:hypothetical protein [Candidatus Neomarinimicrobiota bacterium]
MKANDWVELTDSQRELNGQPGILVRVESVSESRIIIDSSIIDPDLENQKDPVNPEPEFRFSTASQPIIRRWDFIIDDLDKMKVIESTDDVAEWYDLGEDGIEVQFTGGDNGDGTYATGDYWLIPARTFGAAIEWPDDDNGDPASLYPHGVLHHYCELALVKRDAAKFVGVRDLRRIFPDLTALKLRYVSGDGQEAMPGESLPQPLTVKVCIGETPIANAIVKFDLSGGGALTCVKGTVDPMGASLTIATDGDGLAACTWELPDTYRDGTSGNDVINEQAVEVTLFDANGITLDVPLIYNASFSLAERVHYQHDDDSIPDPEVGGTIDYLDAGSTQVALDQLRANSALYIVGGDGQEAKPGEELPQPLEVIVTNGKWRHEGATVRFTVASNAGQLRTDTALEAVPGPIEVTTGDDGKAQCYWILPDYRTGSFSLQYDLQVTAELLKSDGTTAEKPAHFNASLNLAENVTYVPGSPDTLSAADTVQTALDTLDDEKVNRHTPDQMDGPLTIGSTGDILIGSDPKLTVHGGVRVIGAQNDMVVDGDVSIKGSLTVSGETTTVDTTELKIEDNIITVNRFQGTALTPADTLAGLEVFRGDGADKPQLLWDEQAKAWKIGESPTTLDEIATISRLPSGVARTIEQSGHNLTVGDVIRYNGPSGDYVRASAAEEQTAGMFLVSVVGKNHRGEKGHPEFFTLVQAGFVDELEELHIDATGNGIKRTGSGLDSGEFYYLSDKTPGLLTSVEPLGISNPILYADTASSGYVLPYRPSERIESITTGTGGWPGILASLADAVAVENDFQRREALRNDPVVGADSFLHATIGIGLDIGRIIYSTYLELLDVQSAPFIDLGSSGYFNLDSVSRPDFAPALRKVVELRGQISEDYLSRLSAISAEALLSILKKNGVELADLTKLAEDHGTNSNSWNGIAARKYFLDNIYKPLAKLQVSNPAHLGHEEMGHLKTHILEFFTIVWQNLADNLLVHPTPVYDGPSTEAIIFMGQINALSTALNRIVTGYGLTTRAPHTDLVVQPADLTGQGASPPALWVVGHNALDNSGILYRFSPSRIMSALQNNDSVSPPPNLTLNFGEASTGKPLKCCLYSNALLYLISEPFDSGEIYRLHYLPSDELYGLPGVSGGQTLALSEIPDSVPGYRNWISTQAPLLVEGGGSSPAIILERSDNPRLIRLPDDQVIAPTTDWQAMDVGSAERIYSLSLDQEERRDSHILVIYGGGTRILIGTASSSSTSSLVPWYESDQIEWISHVRLHQGYSLFHAVHDQLLIHNPMDEGWAFLPLQAVLGPDYLEAFLGTGTSRALSSAEPFVSIVTTMLGMVAEVTIKDAFTAIERSFTFSMTVEAMASADEFIQILNTHLQGQAIASLGADGTIRVDSIWSGPSSLGISIRSIENNYLSEFSIEQVGMTQGIVTVVSGDYQGPAMPGDGPFIEQESLIDVHGESGNPFLMVRHTDDNTMHLYRCYASVIPERIRSFQLGHSITHIAHLASGERKADGLPDTNLMLVGGSGEFLEFHSIDLAEML